MQSSHVRQRICAVQNKKLKHINKTNYIMKPNNKTTTAPKQQTFPVSNEVFKTAIPALA